MEFRASEDERFPSVSCSANILSSLIDESYLQPHCGLGVLFGRASSISRTTTSDSSDKEIETYQSIVIGAFEALSIEDISTSLELTDCIGIYQCKHDGTITPSYRLVATALEALQRQQQRRRHCATEVRKPQHMLLLVINSSSGSSSWILGLSYALYVLKADSSVNQIELDMITLTGSDKSSINEKEKQPQPQQQQQPQRSSLPTYDEIVSRLLQSSNNYHMNMKQQRGNTKDSLLLSSVMACTVSQQAVFAAAESEFAATIALRNCQELEHKTLQLDAEIEELKRIVESLENPTS